MPVTVTLQKPYRNLTEAIAIVMGFYRIQMESDNMKSIPGAHFRRERKEETNYGSGPKIFP